MSDWFERPEGPTPDLQRTLTLRSYSSFSSVDPSEWDDLVTRSDFPSVFQTHGWLSAWWGTFTRQSYQLRIIVVGDGARLAAAAPLYVDEQTRTATFVGTPHGDYATVLVDRTSREVLQMVLVELGRWSAEGIRLNFRQVPQAAALALALSRASQRTLVVRRTVDHICPQLTLDESTVAPIARKKSARRHAASLRKLGPATFQHLSDAHEITPRLDEFFAQHIRRWDNTPYPSLFLDLKDREFYERLVCSLAPSGRIVFTVLTLADASIAFHFGLTFGPQFYWYKPAFDPAYSRVSPGETLLQELIQMASARGCAVFDFGRGDEPFKRRYASDYPLTENFIVYPNVWRRASHAMQSQTTRVRQAVARRLLGRLRRLSPAAGPSGI